MTLWARGLVDRDLCGCERPVPECPFWQSVLARVFARPDSAAPACIAGAQNRYVRVRPRLALDLWRARRLNASSPLVRFAGLQERMYKAIAAESGSRILIDSTKAPAHALIAARFKSADLFVVHLVRDPRAVAFSWSRNPDAADRRRRSLLGFPLSGHHVKHLAMGLPGTRRRVPPTTTPWQAIPALAVRGLCSRSPTDRRVDSRLCTRGSGQHCRFLTHGRWCSNLIIFWPPIGPNFTQGL